jgi:hypothetical protein
MRWFWGVVKILRRGEQDQHTYCKVDEKYRGEENKNARIVKLPGRDKV